jgi:plasmid stabilization system protein ParE
VNYTVTVRSLAERDLLNAAEYLATIDADLPQRMYDDFERTAERLTTFPFVGREPYRGIRRLAFDIFPYHLYYRISGKTVRVIAVLHSKRDPRTIEETVTHRQ